MYASRRALAALCLVVHHVAAKDCSGAQEWSALAANLTKTPYDGAMTPSQTKPTMAALQIYVTSLEEVNERFQSFTIAGYSRSYWTDSRLTYPSTSAGGCFDEITVPAAYRSKIWEPDLYFENALKVEHGSELITLQASGAIRKSVRMKHKFQCTMDFAWMPFDTQTCTIVLGSYSEDAYKVTLEAQDGAGFVLDEGFSGNTEWRVIGTSTIVERRYFGKEPWDYLILGITLKRYPAFFIQAHVFPSALFVIVSWTGLFIDRSVAPARVAIGVIPVLIMLNLLNSIYGMLPRLSYLTWLSSYLLMCLAYTVVSVLVYGCSSYLRFREMGHKEDFHVLETISKVLVEQEKARAPAFVGQESSVPTFSYTFTPSPAKIGNDKTGNDHAYQRYEKSYTSSKTGNDNAAGLKCRTVKDAVVVEEFPGILPNVQSSSKSILEGDSRSLTKLQQRACIHARDIFDKKRLHTIDKTQLQHGLRKFGMYYTMLQVEEIFVSLGLKHDVPMTYNDFEKFLMTFHKPTTDPQTKYLDNPASLRLDKVMRVGFIASFAVCVCAWLLVLLAAEP